MERLEAESLPDPKVEVLKKLLELASDSSTAGDQEQRDPPRWRGARSSRPGVLRYRAPRL